MRRRTFRATAAIVLVLLGCDSGTGPDGVVAITADPPEIFMIVGANAPIRVLGSRSDGSSHNCDPTLSVPLLVLRHTGVLACAADRRHMLPREIVVRR
jgi:hypothetical protein